ncbi:hypothetical protein Fmac_032400 [Flemingia macrophylla]|uniref:Uncharacterized protein n=1 Tax=Flemingia macrophylla TaxID=520843 RepID=A0ABD1L4U5_9FABA
MQSSTLAMELPSLLEEPQPKLKPKTRIELKHFLELRIKKQVKEKPFTTLTAASGSTPTHSTPPFWTP